MQPHDTTQQTPYGYCHCGCGEKTKIAKQSNTRLGWLKGEPLRFVTGHNKRAQVPPKPPNPSGLCMCGCGQPTPIAKGTSARLGFVKGQSRRFIPGHQGRKNINQRFWDHVQKNFDNGCWLWTGSTDKDGYGKLMHDGKDIRAHRVAWILAHGEIPDNLHVLHNCPNGDNPSCVNPAHLWLGTNNHNIADKVAKGRQIHGEQVNQAKLNESDIVEIRTLAKSGVPKAHIAKRYGVSDVAIWHIIKRRNWAHIP